MVNKFVILNAAAWVGIIVALSFWEWWIERKKRQERFAAKYRHMDDLVTAERRLNRGL